MRACMSAPLTRGVVVRRTATFFVAAAMTGSPAQPASAVPKYTKKVQEILRYLNTHPQDPTKSVPMIYDAHPQVPVPQVAQGITPADVAPTPAGGQSHMARVVCALVSVAFGALDDAHNAVTPLSWGSPTEYGGPPIHGSPASQEASYVHALIHRWEGSHDGEFGTGFSNANYWYKATGHHPVMDQLQTEALKAAGGDARLERFVGGPRLDPCRVVALCAEAQLPGADPSLRAFAQKVVNLEWQLLFDYCYSRLT